jgi:hypothetical protein
MLRKAGRFLEEPKCCLNSFFKYFCTQEILGCISMNTTLIEPIYLILKKQSTIFSYTIFPVNKINVEKMLKL